MCEKAPRDFNEISEFIREFIIYWWSTLYFVCFHLLGLQLKTTGWRGSFFFTIRELENVMSTIQHNHVYGSLRNSNAFNAWRRFETSSEVTLVNWKKPASLNMLQCNTTSEKDCEIQFQYVSRIFDLERQRRANRCAEQGR